MDEKAFLELSDRERDAFIEDVVFKRVACDKWEERNLGSAGGPVFFNDGCEHKSGECYAASEIESIHGLIGGPEQYTTDWRGLGLGIEHANENGIFVQFTSDWDGSGWVTLVGATGGNSPPDGFQATHIKYKTIFLAFFIAYMKALGVLEDNADWILSNPLDDKTCEYCFSQIGLSGTAADEPGDYPPFERCANSQGQREGEVSEGCRCFLKLKGDDEMTEDKKPFLPLEAVKELARLEADLRKAMNARIAAEEPMMKTPEWKAFSEADDLISETRNLFATAEEKFRAGCEGIFEETDEKKFSGGQIKIKITLEWNEELAVLWAMRHKHPELLSIVKNEFKKAMKGLKPNFVREVKTGKMYIDSDLSQYLESDEEVE